METLKDRRGSPVSLLEAFSNGTAESANELAKLVERPKYPGVTGAKSENVDIPIPGLYDPPEDASNDRNLYEFSPFTLCFRSQVLERAYWREIILERRRSLLIVPISLLVGSSLYFVFLYRIWRIITFWSALRIFFLSSIAYFTLIVFFLMVRLLFKPNSNPKYVTILLPIVLLFPVVLSNLANGLIVHHPPNTLRNSLVLIHFFVLRMNWLTSYVTFLVGLFIDVISKLMFWTPAQKEQCGMYFWMEELEFLFVLTGSVIFTYCVEYQERLAFIEQQEVYREHKKLMKEKAKFKLWLWNLFPRDVADRIRFGLSKRSDEKEEDVAYVTETDAESLFGTLEDSVDDPRTESVRGLPRGVSIEVDTRSLNECAQMIPNCSIMLVEVLSYKGRKITVEFGGLEQVSLWNRVFLLLDVDIHHYRFEKLKTVRNVYFAFSKSANPELGCLLALACQERALQLGFDTRVALVADKRVFSGILGKDRMQWDTLADSMNYATRILRSCVRNQIRIDAETKALLCERDGERMRSNPENVDVSGWDYYERVQNVDARSLYIRIGDAHHVSLKGIGEAVTYSLGLERGGVLPVEAGSGTESVTIGRLRKVRWADGTDCKTVPPVVNVQNPEMSVKWVGLHSVVKFADPRLEERFVRFERKSKSKRFLGWFVFLLFRSATIPFNVSTDENIGKRICGFIFLVALITVIARSRFSGWSHRRIMLSQCMFGLLIFVPFRDADGMGRVGLLRAYSDISLSALYLGLPFMKGFLPTLATYGGLIYAAWRYPSDLVSPTYVMYWGSLPFILGVSSLASEYDYRHIYRCMMLSQHKRLCVRFEHAKIEFLLKCVLPHELMKALPDLSLASVHLPSAQDRQAWNDNAVQFFHSFDECTVLFADFVGMTAFGRKLVDAESLFKTLNAVIHTMDASARFAGSTPVSIIGDCYVCYCWDSGQARRMLLTALGILHVFANMVSKKWGVPMSVRVGVCSGPLVGGFCLSSVRSVYEIWGEAAAQCAELEQSAVAGTVNVSRRTLEILRCVNMSDETENEPPPNFTRAVSSSDLDEFAGRGVVETKARRSSALDAISLDISELREVLAESMGASEVESFLSKVDSVAGKQPVPTIRWKTPKD